MNATELFQKGQLQEAIDAQIQSVKSKPADQSVRLFLFELMLFSGDIDRAQKQIDVLKYQEVELQAAVENYKKCLAAERLRRRVFSEGLTPEFLKPAPDHVKVRLEALQQIRAGDHAGARVTLDRAESLTPPIQGTLNEKPISLLRDCDDVLGTVLEVFGNGKYFWVPLEHVDLLAMNPPKFPRDLIWFPANIQIRDGAAGDIFLPTLYHGSGESSDPQIKLGRMTDWKQPEGGPVQGIGAPHVFVQR